jgi:hypothetical protein
MVCVPGWPYQLAAALINGPFTRSFARWVAARPRRR